MIVSAARLHERASSRRRVYRRGGGNDNRPVQRLARAFSVPIESERGSISCFYAFSSRETVSTPHQMRGRLSLENALAYDSRPDLAPHPLHAEQRGGAGFRGLHTPDGKM